MLIRRCWLYRPLALLCLCLSLATPSQAAAERATTSTEQAAQLQLISSQLQLADTLSGNFKQKKFISQLPQPLLSSGRFSLDRTGVLEWQLLQPVQSRLVFDNEGMRQTQNGELVMSIDGQGSGIAMVAKILPAALSADWPVLQQFFSLAIVPISDETNEQPPVRWQLQLLPKEQLLKQVVSRVLLTGRSQVETIILFEANGDRTELAITVGRAEQSR